MSSLFNVNQGDLTFYWKSSYTLAQRQPLASRFAFEVDDGTQRLFFFSAAASGTRLVFNYAAGTTGGLAYFVPVGQEDTIFGKNVTLKIRLTWDGTRTTLYLNDVAGRQFGLHQGHAELDGGVIVHDRGDVGVPVRRRLLRERRRDWELPGPIGAG